MAFLNAAYAQFPHSGMPVEGGCVVGDNSPKTREVFVCSRCHAEAVAWLKQYKEPESKVESRTTARSQGSVAVGAN